MCHVEILAHPTEAHPVLVGFHLHKIYNTDDGFFKFKIPLKPTNSLTIWFRKMKEKSSKFKLNNLFDLVNRHPSQISVS